VLKFNPKETPAQSAHKLGPEARRAASIYKEIGARILRPWAKDTPPAREPTESE